MYTLALSSSSPCKATLAPSASPSCVGWCACHVVMPCHVVPFHTWSSRSQSPLQGMGTGGAWRVTWRVVVGELMVLCGTECPCYTCHRSPVTCHLSPALICAGGRPDGMMGE